MYERKINGHARAGEFLTGNLDFITVATDAVLAPVARANKDMPTKDELVAEGVVARRLDKVIEVISLNGQPVIMGGISQNGSTFTLKFANEHTEAWTKATLEAALLAHAGVTATVTVASDL